MQAGHPTLRHTVSVHVGLLSDDESEANLRAARSHAMQMPRYRTAHEVLTVELDIRWAAVTNALVVKTTRLVPIDAMARIDQLRIFQ